MKIYEVIKPPSPEKLRIDSLKRQKDQVSKQLKATKARAKIQSGEQALQKALS